MNIEQIAKKMVEKGKGILAADESTPTCNKRFLSVGVDTTIENRNEYRDLLLTSNNIEKYISGVIMFDETFKQSTTCDRKIPFPDYLLSKDILPGIKVDKGAKELAGFENEKITEGLDGLRDRLISYYEMGARFAKWRAVFNIDSKNIPSSGAIYANTHALARYAALCQESGLVPIVEPEVLMDGNHSIDRCFEVSKKVLIRTFEQLNLQNVNLKGIVLKPNMIVDGIGHDKQSSPEVVASKTLECLLSTVPKEVPGIAFLSGGQSSDLATQHLNLMNNNHSDKFPWNLTFSFGRALQNDALHGWEGTNRQLAQALFISRAQSNSLATKGVFTTEEVN